MVVVLMMASCYHERNKELHDAMPDNDSIMVNDSISFYTTHHYGIGYNFIVRTDSLNLIVQQPEEHVSQLVTDSFSIHHDEHIAVMDIRIIPADSIDSVWVQVISAEGQPGWIHETTLLPGVVPTDPISQFIMFFSDRHILIALIICVLIAAAYIMRIVQRRQAQVVHFRDIPSFYPTLLCIVVAASATFYASLQMFGADTWRHFYYHPTLNPFGVPLILSIFLFSVWGMLIIGIAVIDDVKQNLQFEDAIIYLLGLSGVCAILYIVFSITTLSYVGYPLLVAYCWFAITRYQRHNQPHYFCGRCGKRIRKKGVCPYCGAYNE